MSQAMLIPQEKLDAMSPMDRARSLGHAGDPAAEMQGGSARAEAALWIRRGNLAEALVWIERIDPSLDGLVRLYERSA